MFNSTDEARKTLKVLRHDFELSSEGLDSDIFEMLIGLQKIFDIVDEVELGHHPLSSDEISDIGEKGCLLIENLVSHLLSKELEPEKCDVEQFTLIIAQWVIKNNGLLRNIHTIVDGLAYLANAIQDKESLTQLATYMGQVANACSAIIKHDLENSDPSRPWRLLNINRGIVATRSHDLTIMRKVFSDICDAIPLDAPDFFAEGMSEMVSLGYPEPVRDLMNEYYEKTTMPSVH